MRPASPQNTMTVSFAAQVFGRRANQCNQGSVGRWRRYQPWIGVTAASQAEGATNMRVVYADGNKRVRLDFFAFPQATTAFGSIAFNVPANQVLSLIPERKKYYILPAAGRANPGLLLSDKMTHVRRGEATVAGLTCTDWKIANGNDIQGTACVTSDGVVLRASRSLPRPGSLLALAVTYATPSADTFAPPPDLQLAPSQ
jgi:hypothetical protein